jgi:hypothetical protein
MIRLIVCALALFAAACGSDAPAAAAPGRLVVQKTFAAARPLFIEGSVTHLRIVGEDGAVVVDEVRHGRPLFDQTLPAGAYTVQTVERPCDGNCGYLDPPVESTRCELAVRIAAGERTKVSLALEDARGAAACDLR